VTDEFIDAIVASPLGAALLAVLEARARPAVAIGRWPAPTPGAVAAAADLVAELSFGDLVALAVRTAVYHVGPWITDAPATAAAACRYAAARLPIAAAVADRFGTRLHEPIDGVAQEWWTDGLTSPWLERLAPLFHDFEHVYGAGQVTWAGLWTATDPPAEVHQELIGAWELERGPVRRWRLPVAAGARVFEVHRPADWARLAMEHPRDGAPHPEWELPGLNQHSIDLSMLLAVPGQRAARTAIRRHLVPDWRAVAARYDGVHLSWAGFITTEGCITDLGDGDVALLRYWFSERTLWLADVFGEPASGADPVRTDPVPAVPSVTAAVRSPADRRRVDGHALHRLLGR
jgi:hypothetical protein